MAFCYGSYLKLSLWSEGEAICLLSSIDPSEYKELLQAELENLSRDPWDGFDITFSGTAYRQSEILRNQRSDRLVGMQGIIDPIKAALERDVMTKIITPDYTDNRTDYFAPAKTITWSILKGYCLPTELMNFAWKAERQAEAIVDDSTGNHAGAEPASTTAIQSNSNELDLSGLLNAPAKQDDWFNVIDDMTKSYFREYGKIPNCTQAWGWLSADGLEGYCITAGTDRGEKCLIMPGVNPLSKSAFSKRWEKYTANKAQ